MIFGHGLIPSMYGKESLINKDLHEIVSWPDYFLMITFNFLNLTSLLNIKEKDSSEVSGSQLLNLWKI